MCAGPGAGSHFDPTLVEVFLEIQSEFRNIALRYADSVGRQETTDDDDAVETRETFASVADIEAISTFAADSVPG